MNSIDREADVFAMSLLMPSHLVRREWEKFERGGEHREEDIEAMAALFEVSQI
jgi:Zn-dependent peptidase ImmA (M78 family)